MKITQRTLAFITVDPQCFINCILICDLLTVGIAQTIGYVGCAHICEI